MRSRTTTGFVALVLPVPAVDALPGRDQGAGGFRAGSLLVEHQVAAAADRLGVAVELGVEGLRIGDAPHLPGINHGAAGFHVDLVFELAAGT